MTVIDDVSVDRIPNRRTAVAFHRRMKATSCAPLDLGKFYLQLRGRGLWPSQAAMARDFGVSTAQVSRCMAIARLPADVLSAVGGKSRISYRTGKSMGLLIDSIGVDTVCARAKRVPRGKEFSASTVLNALATGKQPSEKHPIVTLTISPSARHIGIESPEIDRLLPILGELEKMIQVFVAASLA